MARLNISLPDDLYERTKKWREVMNLSEICSRALEREIAAAESLRTAGKLLEAIRPPTEAEKNLGKAYGLWDVRICNTSTHPSAPYVELGQEAASYLGQMLMDDSQVAIAGGRQIWSMIRSVAPARKRITITAIGVRQNDPHVLHAHPNTLVTLLWLLHSPEAKAHLIGSEEFSGIWDDELPTADVPRYFVFASCAPFQPDSAFANLLGTETTESLLGNQVTGDFAYIFFNEDRELVDLPNGRFCSRFSSSYLKSLAQRDDARVVLVAGGAEKLSTIRKVLDLNLCNTLITDRVSASVLQQEQFRPD